MAVGPRLVMAHVELEHTVIVGPTKCGKTTLGYALAAGFMARGIHTLVCDPLYNPWPATWVTTSMEEFLAVARDARRCALFVDEAGISINRAVAPEWIVTTGRHWGHVATVMSHGGRQMSTLMRAQFSRICLFCCTPRVAEMWAEDFNEPALLLACDEKIVPRFCFLLKERYRPIRLVRLPAPLRLAA